MLPLSSCKANSPKANQLAPNSVATADLAQAYAFLGVRDQASKMLEKLVERAEQNYYSPTEIGFTYARLCPENHS